MDLRYSDSDEAFRAELREWLTGELPKLPAPPHREDWPTRRAYDTDWQRRLYDASYAGLNWPKEYGGRGASPSEQLIFLEETTRARAPYVGVNFVGQLHAGPTIIAEGTDEQKRDHLEKILRGDEVWCQGFSEPSAGSDLASLRTKAVRDGDHYVVTGQKIWCSFAQVGDFGELLVRTDPDAPKHKGITWLMLPMHLPGIEVRPLKTALGSSEFAEVFLDEVRVPVSCRVGAENDGWRVTNVTLSFERGTAFVSEMVDAMRLVEDLSPYANDPTHRRELGHIAAELDALWALTKRNITQAAKGGVMGRGAMMIKLPYSELRQRLGELSLRVLDRASLSIEDFDGLHNGEFVEERLRTLALTIAAGTSQIQRNIIGERVLGLPKEPK
jgi:alkylation response protein AidB-like acyl-CoA dehydrogenase